MKGTPADIRKSKQEVLYENKQEVLNVCEDRVSGRIYIYIYIKRERERERVREREREREINSNTDITSVLASMTEGKTTTTHRANLGRNKQTNKRKIEFYNQQRISMFQPTTTRKQVTASFAILFTD